MEVKHNRIAIFNDTSFDHEHYGCRAVMGNLKSRLLGLGLDVVFTVPFNVDWRQHRSDYEKQGLFDAILVNGEGSMHSSHAGWRARALSEIGQFAKSCCKVPSVVVNATFHNNDRQFYDALKYFDLVFVRDSYSREQGESENLEVSGVVYDLSLSLPFVGCLTNRNGIGVTDSVNASKNFLLRKFAMSTGSEFRAMTVPDTKNFQIKSLLKPHNFAKWVQQKRQSSGVRFETVEDFIEWLSTKELIVTGRYHTVTLCLLTETPFICLESNTPKIRALLQDWGIDTKRLVEPACLASSTIKTNDYSFSPEERSNIRANLNKNREATNAMFWQLRELLVQTV